ncbi:MAG: PQQ-binding-like beta-propeller repeat protein [Gordonia sp. (in: high G+C Gram-positive bacteria)]|uniref:outer membrane protein assembly factor BamB family protein n=1 Tax=Gordonia sp. (in: high G+C Gram-positive bacteria) TaxID=84139 RepID=UPI0039E4BC20
MHRAVTGHTPQRRRRGLQLSVLLATVAALVLSACSDGHSEVRSYAAAGWPMYGGNAAASNYTPTTVRDGVKLQWSRPTGGPITAPIALNNNGDVSITAQTQNGCNVFVFDNRDGRKQICKRMAQGVQFNAALMDEYNQPFIGEQTMFLSYNGGGSIRWRMPVIGVPLSARFTGPGRVLVTTTQGQLLLLNAQTSDFVAPEVRLRPNADPAQPLFGLGDCITGGPQCAVPAPPAVDEAAQRIYLNFTPEGAKQSQVRAMSIGDHDGQPQITNAWTASVGGGVVGPPTLSADGKTVYTFGRDGKLYALNAGDGTQRWSYDLGGFGFATLAVSPDGTLIPTGSIGAPLTILKDAGTKAEQVVKRDDVQTVSLAAITGADSAWTVMRTGNDQHLELIEVGTKDGETKRTLELPGATGFATGVAVSAAGAVAVATNLGEVFYFN